jgi:thioredoxin reductase (NADPH)
MHDVVIIGAGPAGIAAALWCEELGLEPLLLEAAPTPGGHLHSIYNPIHNYPACAFENGEQFFQRLSADLDSAEFDVWTQTEIESVDLKGKRVSLRSGEELQAIFLIIATGTKRRELGIPGEKELAGKGILESGVRDAELYRGQDVCIVGGGDAAVENALLLAQTSATVTLVHRRKRLRARQEFVEQLRGNHCITFFTEALVTRIIGTDRVEGVEISKQGALKPVQMAVRGVLIRIGVEPNTSLFADQVARDEQGYLVVNSQQETSIPNVFAIGDVANPLAPTISGAVGSAATAAKVIASRIGNK